MVEPTRDGVPRRYEETMQPQNPPNSVLNKSARRAAVWSYFVPIVVLFAVIGVALLFWSNRSARPEAPPRTEVGTVGSTQGGFDPQPRPATTRDEVEGRGDDLEPVTSIGDLRAVEPRSMNGRRVTLTRVTVDAAQSNMFWLRDGDSTYLVITPDDAPRVKPGARVSVAGRIQSDAQGGLQIRADRVRVDSESIPNR